MATELVLLGTAGAPLPVAGRAGISSALVVDGRVFVIDCGRGAPSGFADAGLDFARLVLPNGGSGAAMDSLGGRALGSFPGRVTGRVLPGSIIV